MEPGSRFLIQTDKYLYEIEVVDPERSVVFVAGEKHPQRFHTRFGPVAVGETTKGETILSITRSKDAT